MNPADNSSVGAAFDNSQSDVPARDFDRGRSKTLVLEDPDQVLEAISKAIESARDSFSTCTNLSNLVGGYKLLTPSYKKALSRLKQNHLSKGFRWIVSIDDGGESLEIVRRLMDLGIQIRHSKSRPVIQFGIVDSSELFTTFESYDGTGPVSNVLFSKDLRYINQFGSAFEELWNEAVDAQIRIRELEGGFLEPATKLVKGDVETAELESSFLKRATGSFCRASSGGGLPDNPEEITSRIREAFSQSPAFKFQLITDLQKQNLDYNLSLMHAGVEIRHIERNKVRFALSKNEYLGSEPGIAQRKTPGSDNNRRVVMWSTNPEVVSQANQIFEMMWESAVPAADRIRDIEAAVELPRIEVITDGGRTVSKFIEVVKSAERSIDIVFPSINAFHREERIGVIDLMEELAGKRGIKIKTLLPLDDSIRRRLYGKPDVWVTTESRLPTGGSSRATTTENKIEFREINITHTQTKATIVIVDNSRCLIIEQKDDSQLDFDSAIGLATFSNSRPTVASNIVFFEKLWHENLLRTREERSRRQSELLQDILTHDIRNYNQVLKLSAELLQERLAETGDEESLVLTRELLKAIDGATLLVERGKRLGRILSADKPMLHPVVVLASLNSSLSLITKGYTEKKIIAKIKVDGNEIGDSYPKGNNQGPSVLADDFLDEIFANVFSNSVKYAAGDEVNLDIQIDTSGDYCKIQIGDNGPGIPETMRGRVFERYVAGAHGSGLGMSIIHALVVGRYEGTVKILDSRPDKAGTTIEITLPLA